MTESGVSDSGATGAGVSRPGAHEAGSSGAAGRRGSRRAQRPAPDGVDPRPSEHALDARAGEDQSEGWGDRPAGAQAAELGNDARLARDRPPHWG